MIQDLGGLFLRCEYDYVHKQVELCLNDISRNKFKDVVNGGSVVDCCK